MLIIKHSPVLTWHPIIALVSSMSKEANWYEIA